MAPDSVFVPDPFEGNMSPKAERAFIHPDCEHCRHGIIRRTVGIRFFLAGDADTMPNHDELAEQLTDALPREWHDRGSGDTWWVLDIQPLFK